MSSQVSTFKFQKVTDILSLPDPEFIIENLIVKGSFAVLFGAPGVGKSFLALAWAFAVAAGESWLDRKVIGGPVIYIAAEGSGGLKLRVTALLRHEDYGNDTPCRFLDRPISLTDSDEVKAFIAEIKNSVGKPALIIIDTLARCFVGGDENSAKDMGLFIHGVETIKRETGATVLVVHHTGKNEKSGARGSSALMGAADTMISCGGDMGLLGLKCEKQKDAEEFQKISLSFRTIELENGQSSCVLGPFDDAINSLVLKCDPAVKKMLEALERFGADGATNTEWQKACESEGINRETFVRRLRELKKAKVVEKDGDKQGARYRLVKSEPVSVSN